MSDTYVLTVKCPDRVGLVAAVTGFLAEHNAWITEAHHHSDEHTRWFFMRQEVRADSLTMGFELFRDRFTPIAEQYGMAWELTDQRKPKRVVILATDQDHCIADIFHRWRTGEYHIEIPCVISNHQHLAQICSWYEIPYHYVPVTPSSTHAAFDRISEILEAVHADVVVLARFMQIVPPSLCQRFRNRMINIHHGFLPSFSGARPYHQAYQYGVKMIGATCHYVTEELDQGPIIEQDVVRISHADPVEKLVRLGRDVERMVLARGLRYHLEDRVIVHDNKTVVFA